MARGSPFIGIGRADHVRRSWRGTRTTCRCTATVDPQLAAPARDVRDPVAEARAAGGGGSCRRRDAIERRRCRVLATHALPAATSTLTGRGPTRIVPATCGAGHGVLLASRRARGVAARDRRAAARAAPVAARPCAPPASTRRARAAAAGAAATAHRAAAAARRAARRGVGQPAVAGARRGGAGARPSRSGGRGARRAAASRAAAPRSPAEGGRSVGLLRERARDDVVERGGHAGGSREGAAAARAGVPRAVASSVSRGVGHLRR